MGYLDEVTNRALEQAALFFDEFDFRQLPQSDWPVEGLVAAWQGDISCNSVVTSIIVGLTLEFPDELPKIFLTKSFEDLPIPHVDSKLFVCTYDSNSVDFFAENVAGIIHLSIEKARQIISDGISQANQGDYATEFLAYWELDNKSKAYSILDPDNQTRRVSTAKVHLSNDHIAVLVADDRQAIMDFAANVNLGSTIEELPPALYLPLPRPFPPPFPSTNSQLFSMLDDCGTRYSEAVTRFLIDNSYEGIIVFSVIINDDYALAGWRHVNGKPEEVSKGYRRGKVDSRVVRARIANHPIERLQIERLDLARLQGRTGGYRSALRGKTVCVVGCGSIGSKVAFNLAQVGVDSLVLIDKERLDAANVGRHLCGVTELKKAKVEAVSRAIRQHLPYVRIQSFEKTFRGAFGEAQEVILSCDLVISATANPALERRLNKMQTKVAGFPSVLYAWIEPLGVASHAVLVSDTKASCFECCLAPQDLSFRFQVTSTQRGKYTKQEAGCQSSFVPYSALNADQAASIAVRLALKSLTGEATHNTRYVHFGDLQKAREMGVGISEEYASMPSLTTMAFDVHRGSDCRACSDTGSYA